MEGLVFLNLTAYLNYWVFYYFLIGEVSSKLGIFFYYLGYGLIVEELMDKFGKEILRLNNDDVFIY